MSEGVAVRMVTIEQLRPEHVQACVAVIRRLYGDEKGSVGVR